MRDRADQTYVGLYPLRVVLVRPAAPTPLPDRNLDLMRAIAVLAVLVSHLVKVFGVRDPRLNAMGNLGVVLFFVHTALVLMASLERLEGPLQGWALARTFYVRREFRIYPLAWATIALYLLFNFPTSSTPWAAQDLHLVHTPATILTNLLLIQNLAGRENVSEVLWTLPLEVQMYALLPGCYLLMRAGRLRALVLAIAAAMGAGLLVYFWTQPGSELHGVWRLTIFEYVPCFLGGVLAYYLLRFGSRQPKFPAWTWLPLLLSWGAVTILFVHNSRANPPRGWPFALGVGCLIPLVQNRAPDWGARAGELIARYSYGIYLLHMPAMTVGFQWGRSLPLAAQWGVFLTLVVAGPVAAYHLIEAPGIALGRRMSQPPGSHRPLGTESISGVP